MDKEFVDGQVKVLLNRLENKKKILKDGGQQAMSHSEKDITRIEFALKRVKEEQYGLCVNCGTPIKKDRLISIPETPFCIDCAK